jgi:hypothetical protein
MTERRTKSLAEECQEFHDALVNFFETCFDAIGLLDLLVRFNEWLRRKGIE